MTYRLPLIYNLAPDGVIGCSHIVADGRRKDDRPMIRVRQIKDKWAMKEDCEANVITDQIRVKSRAQRKREHRQRHNAK